MWDGHPGDLDGELVVINDRRHVAHPIAQLLDRDCQLPKDAADLQAD
jgi:hypothetical protein